MADLISCPKCGHKVSKEAAKCVYCGHRLRDEPVRRDASAECPNCGAPMDHNDKLCEYCGRKVVPIKPYKPGPKGAAKGLRESLEELDVKALKGDPVQLLALLKSRGFDVQNPVDLVAGSSSTLKRLVDRGTNILGRGKESHFGYILAAIAALFVVAMIAAVLIFTNVQRSQIKSQPSNLTDVTEPTPAQPAKTP